MRRSRRIAGLPVVDYSDDCVSEYSNTLENEDIENLFDDYDPSEPKASRTSEFCMKISQYMFFVITSTLLVASLLVR